MYSYDNQSVVVANSHPKGFGDLRIEVRVWDIQHDEVYSESATVDVPAHGNTRALLIPSLDKSSPVYFIDLRMYSPDGPLISRNFYWIPSELDILDHANASWHYTPISKHADLTALRDLPSTRLSASASVLNGGPKASVQVELSNHSDDLAFFVQLRLADQSGEDILPVLWSDNYVSLPKRDTCLVHATLPDGMILNGQDLHLHIRGLNVPEQKLTINRKEEISHEQDFNDVYYRRPVRDYQLRNGKG